MSFYSQAGRASVSGGRVTGPRLGRSSGGFRNAFALLLVALFLGFGSANARAAEPKAPLDLNVATAEQLEALPGIGEVKAAAILAVRAERGGFRSVDELESVRGIGPALLGKLRGQVKVGPPRGRQARRVATK
ncbi:MAG: ComEA family DNA-binding protein [Myxococcota bacterium]